MSEKQHSIDDLTVCERLCDLVLASSHEDLLAALGQEEYTRLASQGRSLMWNALAEAQLASRATQPASCESRVSLRAGLGALLAMLKRRDGLSDRELADQASIDGAELRRIELDPEYQPGPRTISKLERFFNLPPRSIAVLCSAVEVNATEFSEEAARFAAKSASLGKLSKEERQHLNQFVKLLEELTSEGN